MLNKKHPQPNTLSQWRTGRGRRLYFSAVLMLALCAALACPALAADTDPLTIVNNLSDFIFSCIKAVGVIVLGWGIVQLGMSIQSHDASQRTQGILCVFGGLLIAFSKEILSAMGTWCGPSGGSSWRSPQTAATTSILWKSPEATAWGKTRWPSSPNC